MPIPARQTNPYRSESWEEQRSCPFGRQSGYRAFSVSKSVKESVISYIASQESHHRKMTFQEEFRSLLQKHGIAFDERYVWD
jgi:putative transposase